MGLILPQKLNIKWATTSRQHYINLGYQYTKIGDLFEVDVEHLSNGSANKIKIKCDYCDETFYKAWKDYLNLRGTTYCCPECLKHKKKVRNESGELIFIEIPYRNKEWLKNEYVIKGRKAEDIANECGISPRTLREWISVFNLTEKYNKTNSITKKTLEELYRVQKKTTCEIGSIYGVSDGTILNLLKEFGIKRFSPSERVKIYLYEKGGIENVRKTQSTMKNRIMTSCKQRGIAISDFKGFSSTEQHIARNNSYYKEWQRKVFERDNYTCQCCGKYGGNLNAHHLYNFSKYIFLRYDVSNGITFCEECHLVNYPNSFHSLYGERNNTPEQVKEFIKIKKLKEVV